VEALALSANAAPFDQTAGAIMTSQNSQQTAPSLDAYVTTPEQMTGTGSDAAHEDRPAVVDVTLSAPIVAALERTWHAIRTRHPDLPTAVVSSLPGSDGAPAGWLKLGHFAAMRWQNSTKITDRPGPLRRGSCADHAGAPPKQCRRCSRGRRQSWRGKARGRRRRCV
jgi:hypothetical protein